MKLNFSPGLVAAGYIVVTQAINLALLFGASITHGQEAGIQGFYLAVGVAVLRGVGWGYVTADEIKNDSPPAKK